MIFRLALSLIVFGATVTLASTAPGPDLAAHCLQAADRAADRAGVPRAVMRALTLTETGRNRGGRLQPWPWTVNMEGAGHWFDSRAEALAYVRREQARGAESFDVGCFQINHRWHGEHFASLESMFDPMVNATYAAGFIRALFDETGNWSEAAGFYHSRTPEFYHRYRARFDRLHAAAAAEIGKGVESARALPPQTLAPLATPLAAGSIGTAAHNPGGVAITVVSGRPSPAETRGRSLLLTAARGPLAAAARRPLIGD
jgi:hypothetical protein